METLAECLEELKTQMALNVLNFDQKKTEVIVFGPSVTGEACSVDIGPVAQYVKLIVRSTIFRMDKNFRLDSQISALVKSSFFQLRQLAKIKKNSIKRSF